MEYDVAYLDLKHAMIKHLLLDMPSNIFDISYAVTHRKVLVQFIIEVGTSIDGERITALQHFFPHYTFTTEAAFLTKESFNAGADEYPPSRYKCLQHCLFSMKEA